MLMSLPADPEPGEVSLVPLAGHADPYRKTMQSQLKQHRIPTANPILYRNPIDSGLSDPWTSPTSTLG